MKTGELIANIRETKGVLQKELAKIIDIDPVVLNRIEKGKRPVRGNELKAIADYFNVSVDYLLGRDFVNYNSTLSGEQESLLKNFNTLNDSGRNVLLEIVESLRITHSKKNKPDKQNVIQKNSGGNNYLAVNGDQFVN